MSFAVFYVPIFSKMQLGLFLWNETWIFPPNAFF